MCPQNGTAFLEGVGKETPRPMSVSGLACQQEAPNLTRQYALTVLPSLDDLRLELTLRGSVKRSPLEARFYYSRFFCFPPSSKIVNLFFSHHPLNSELCYALSYEIISYPWAYVIPTPGVERLPKCVNAAPGVVFVPCVLALFFWWCCWR